MNTLLGFLLIISILFSPLKVSSYFRTRHSRKKKEPLVDPSPQKSILSTSAHAPKILCQRSYDTKKGDSFRISLVIGLGFEPRTHSLEGCCSIQLSYGALDKQPIIGRDSWIRTSDILLPKQALYQAELCPAKLKET